MARALSPAEIPMPYVAAGESPPPLLDPVVLPAGDVWLELAEDVSLVPEASAGGNPCVFVDLAVCIDPGVDEDVLKEEFVKTCCLSRYSRRP